MPPNPNKEKDEPDREKFDRVVNNLLNTPPKPRKPKGERDNKPDANRPGKEEAG